MSNEIGNEAEKLGIAIKGCPSAGQSATVRQADTLRKLFGTTHDEIAGGLFRHCLKVLKEDEASDEFKGNDERMFMVAAIAEIKPRDGVERMLSVQMAVTHVAMIRAGRSMAYASTLEQVKAHNNGYTKLARTYAAQMEALRKHRNGGKQTVVVQRVNVEDGGQAIVGAVQAE
jgi:hypothetical protein